MDAPLDALDADRPVSDLPSTSAPGPSSWAAMAATELALFDQNEGKPGDRELGEQYDIVNASFFAGSLPKIPVMWESRLRGLGSMAGGNLVVKGMTDGHLILLHPELRDDATELRRHLCHEMTHVHFFSIGDTEENHGRAFQAELRRLSEQGAFEGIVATPDQRTRLRAALDVEKARLDAEVRELGRIKAELENTPENGGFDSDGFNQRVSDFKARSHRYDVAAAAYNAKTERYRLMLTYPDGLAAGFAERHSVAR